jgi:hypothetical protein
MDSKRREQLLEGIAEDSIRVRAAEAKLAAEETTGKRLVGIPPAEKRDAGWFKYVWETYCRGSKRMHLRDIQYKLTTIRPPIMMAPGVRPNEKDETGLPKRGAPKRDPVKDAISLPFTHTSWTWGKLQEAAKVARKYLFVDAREFEEHRSPTVKEHSQFRKTPKPFIMWDERSEIKEPLVAGYDYHPADQPYTIEVWCEKSTMDDVLEPLCDELGINYQAQTGMFSITRAVEMLCRARKPTRLFYISDFDPAGRNMPAAFAKALAYYSPIYASGVDIRMTQLALTAQQVIDYDLPQNVMDKEKIDSDYATKFIELYGDAFTELDALEAIRPGELGRLVREAVEPYIDRDLAKRCYEREREAQRKVKEQWDAEIVEETKELDEIKDEMEYIKKRLAEKLAPYNEKLDEIQARCNREKAPIEEEIEAIEKGVQDDELLPLEEESMHKREEINERKFQPDLLRRAEPHVATEDGMEWLFEQEKV